MMKIKLMTFNIQHGAVYKSDGCIDLDFTVRGIISCGADIVGLNEIRGNGTAADYTAQAQYIASALGWYYYFAPAIMVGGENPYGNAIVSRFPLSECEKINIPDPVVKDENEHYETRCILRAVADTGEKQFTLFVTHAGLAKSERYNAVSTLRAVIAKEKELGVPFALTGDFNMTPDSEILSPLKEVIHDTEPMMKGCIYTFPSDSPKSKIDYIFVSDSVEIISAVVLPYQTSDHRPIVAELKI